MNWSRGGEQFFYLVSNFYQKWLTILKYCQTTFLTSAVNFSADALGEIFAAVYFLHSYPLLGLYLVVLRATRNLRCASIKFAVENSCSQKFCCPRYDNTADSICTITLPVLFYKIGKFTNPNGIFLNLAVCVSRSSKANQEHCCSFSSS
jgi:hypothetical protein